jgi:hypothetical protein
MLTKKNPHFLLDTLEEHYLFAIRVTFFGNWSLICLRKRERETILKERAFKFFWDFNEYTGRERDKDPQRKWSSQGWFFLEWRER